jgi:FkbM family methyltransferase
LRLGSIALTTHGPKGLDRLLHPRGPVEFDVALRDVPKPLRLRSHDWVVFEIFGSRAYDVDLAPVGPIRRVLDAGANVGLASIVLAQRLPEAEFLCVEPASWSHRLLRTNLVRQGVRAETRCVAITRRSGTCTMTTDDKHPALARITADGESGETVRAMSLMDLLDDMGWEEVDLLKLDIEGAEAELLAAAGDWSGRVRAVLAEIHPPLTTTGAKTMLAAHGFEPLPLPRSPVFDDVVFLRRRRED